MSTATGNVKISELQGLSSIGEGAKLRIPVSKDKSSTSTPDWESFSVNGDVLSQFMETSLGLSTVKTDITNLKTSSTTQTNNLNGLFEHLCKYNSVNNISFDAAESNKVILTDGTKVNRGTSSYGYFISSKIPLKQGNLYLWTIDSETINNNDISFITKVHERIYADSTGATHSEITYEPLPTHYHSNEYGTPSYPSIVFFAPEDMEVVISGGNGCGTMLAEIKYGIFFEIADQLLSINGELMKVIVEAITKNRKDIESLYEKTKSLGDIHVTSIDSDEFPSVQGEPMVVVANRAPGSETPTHGADVPNKIGQIWVNTADGVAYIAISLGNTSGWKQITNG